MRHIIGRTLLILVLIGAGLAWNVEFQPTSENSFVTTVEARRGRPATPVSYAGVARRTTVRVATPGVGTPANRGGPVNRVGRR
jgi:hypothetical protein